MKKIALILAVISLFSGYSHSYSMYNQIVPVNANNYRPGTQVGPVLGNVNNLQGPQIQRVGGGAVSARLIILAAYAAAGTVVFGTGTVLGLLVWAFS